MNQHTRVRHLSITPDPVTAMQLLGGQLLTDLGQLEPLAQVRVVGSIGLGFPDSARLSATAVSARGATVEVNLLGHPLQGLGQAILDQVWAEGLAEADQNTAHFVVTVAPHRVLDGPFVRPGHFGRAASGEPAAEGTRAAS